MTTSMIHVPTSAEEFLKPKPADLITVAQEFLRNHWEEVKEDFLRISGEEPSKHGSLSFDEAECVFKIQKIAEANGFAALGTVSTHRLWLAVRRGYKRDTGVTVLALESQNKRLRIEDKTGEDD